MNPIASVLKMHRMNKVMWFIVPWSILFSSFVINIVIAALSTKHGANYTGGICSIFIYLFVVAIVSLNQTFTFSLGLSVRRTDYFFGTVLWSFFISAFVAIVLYLLSLVEVATNGWGVELYFFHFPYLSDGPAIAQMWIWFVGIMFVCFGGLLFASVFRRFGRIGLFGFSFLLFLIVSAGAVICTRLNWWGHVFGWFVHHSAVDIVSWLMIVVVVCGVLSYIMLRRTTN